MSGSIFDNQEANELKERQRLEERFFRTGISRRE